ncbi:hypothetical protein [Bacillus wiedmannii]|uniref:hypothetical protein n=1 Tax=Bacillus wiedmannii TaxID=1890302 RepID=UPI0015CF436E|nr:hypothetical protein [Bacillus wiedmannii]
MAGLISLHCFTLYQPLERGKVKLLLRFLQKISPNQLGSSGWFALLQSFIPYQPLERGKVKLSFAVFYSLHYFY